MIEDMVPKLCEIGVLEHDKLTEIYLCRDVSKKDKPSLAEVDLTEEQIDALEIKLADFAAQKGIERPLSVQSWAMGLQDGSD
jgi:hypothetical protein